MTKLIEPTKNVVGIVNSSNKIAVIPSKTAGLDAFAAGVGLYKMLKKMEKNVSFVYTGSIPKGCEDLLPNEEISSDIFERELMVSINYSNTPAAKVHYSTENDVLYLKVKPIDKEFNLNRVKSQIRGFDFDLVFTVGAQEMRDFGQTYRELKEEFDSAKIINVDNTDKNARFGFINAVDPYASSLSLLMLRKSVEWKLNLGADAAKSFLLGISNKETP